MDNKEAINRLGYLKTKSICALLADDKKEHWLYEDVQGTIEALDMAVKALIKQIPKKPNITLQNGYCGNCRLAWGYERLIEEQRCGYKYFQFCPICGHKIDWSEE